MRVPGAMQHEVLRCRPGTVPNTNLEFCKVPGLQRVISCRASPGTRASPQLVDALRRAAELRVHLKGALKNGCTAEEIREVLLLVALYCGIPAANEAHRAAVEVMKEEQKP